MKKNNLEEAIKRLPLNALAHLLAIPTEIPDQDGKNVSCFFPDRHTNGDRDPSFGFYDNITRFKCFSCGISGRGPDLIALLLGMDPKESILHFIKLAGLPLLPIQRSAPEIENLQHPQDLHNGGREESISEAPHHKLAASKTFETSGRAIEKLSGDTNSPSYWEIPQLRYAPDSVKRLAIIVDAVDEQFFTRID